MPIEPEELKNYKILRNYLANPLFFHPNLIQFVRFFRGDDLLNGLTEAKVPQVINWSKNWSESFEQFKESVPYNTSILSDQLLKESQISFLDLDCARKASGNTLTEIFTNIKQSPLVKKQAVQIFLKIVGAVTYINALGFNHNDISTNNVLFDLESSKVTLIDIGAARKYHCLEKGWVELLSGNGEGSPLCMPPEIMKCLKQTKLKLHGDRLDSFGLGVIFYQLLTGKSDVNIFNMDEKSFNGSLEFQLPRTYLDLGKDEDKMNLQIRKSMRRDGITDKTIQDLLLNLLHIDNSKRLSIFAILANPLFSEYKDDVLSELKLSLKAAIFIGNKFAVDALSKNHLSFALDSMINFHQIDKVLTLKSEIRAISELLKNAVIPYLQEFEPQTKKSINTFNTFAIPKEVVVGMQELCSKLTDFLDIYREDRNTNWIEGIKKLLETYINQKHKYKEIIPKIEYFYNKINEIQSSDLQGSDRPSY